MAAVSKEPVKLRLDPDVLAALRTTGDGWQTRINDMLRASLSLAGRLGQRRRAKSYETRTPSSRLEQGPQADGMSTAAADLTANH